MHQYRIFTFRDDGHFILRPTHRMRHLARMCEDGRAVAFQMLIEPQAKTSFGQHTSKRGLADFKRIAPQVVAIQLDQEGVEQHPGVVLPVAQPFPPWPARALG
jgi:hypothetical protein